MTRLAAVLLVLGLCAPPASAAARPSLAQRIFASMTERERIGQLLMVDASTSGLAAATERAIVRYHVGSVILDRTTTAGLAAIQQLTRSLQALAPRGAKLFVATDQEGGDVQRLQGPGFSTIPSGVAQGHLAVATLQADWQRWGRQLHRAGVTVDLAPVLDIVPAGFGSNPPIGELDREYGHTPTSVTRHGRAALRGLAAAHVDATAKHFPGLGRVRANTDTTYHVVDSVTTRDDQYLAPFRAAVSAGIPFVMVSTAIYSKIARRPAAFSSRIVTGMLRHDLGFRGVIVSDDLGAAATVRNWPVGQRAVRFIVAGGDLVLTVDAGQAPAMADAIYARTKTSPAFKRKVDAAALLVLQAKQARGLLS